MALRTIIVEDEPLSRAFLNNLLLEFCPEVHVLTIVPTEAEAIEAIERLQPDLVFLDIELQQGTGFEVLRKTQQHKYQAIFTTAFDHHSIKAIKFSGVDYMQKPIDFEALQLMITNVIRKQKCSSGEIAIQHLLQTLDNDNVPKHLLLQTAEGGRYIAIADIVFIELVETGCVFYTDNANVTSTCKGIKELEQMLYDQHFLRVQNGYIINCKKIDASAKPENGFVTMMNKTNIAVSPKKEAELKNFLLMST